MTDLLPPLPPRAENAHKGDFGKILIVGGSRGMAGAVALAGRAALRSGAGLVTLAVPDVCQDLVASFEPCYMTVGLASDREGRLAPSGWGLLADLAANATCVACGPGLGRSPGVEGMVARAYREIPLPMVMDADALNALAALPDGWPEPQGPRILTPHPGEFARLAEAEFSSREAACQRAHALAREREAILVLKGHQTLITQGERHQTNGSGNPGMATAGSGDVLTGVIVALLGQKLAPYAAACLGVYLHGLAGDRAAERWGQVSMTAADMLDELPRAFQQHAAAAATHPA